MNKRKPAWCKVMMAIVYAVCIEIIIYAEVVMWVKSDLSALYALIGVPAAMMGVFWSYSAKSRAENTQGGITYDTAMLSHSDHIDELEQEYLAKEMMEDES